MNHAEALQNALDFIEYNIKDEMNALVIADAAGYSVPHFSRIIGTSVMSYVIWRKLNYALHDLSCGMKVIDCAMEYGFETYARRKVADRFLYTDTPAGGGGAQVAASCRAVRYLV